MAYAKLFSTITESSLWSASKDARLLFLSMLAKADAGGFIEAALPGLARLANLTMPETEAALAELMAPDPYSKSKDFDGARVIKCPRGWALVNYEFYRDQQSSEDRRTYMHKYMQERRRKQDVSNVNPVLALLGQAEAEAEANTEGERDATALTESLQPEGDGFADFLRDHGCKIIKAGECIIDEWRKAVKGLKPKQVREILEAAKPGITWPSEFKKHREARGV